MSPRRRRRRRSHRRDGTPGTRGPDRHPHQPAGAGVERADADGHRRGTRAKAARDLRQSGNGYFVEMANCRRRSATPWWTRRSPSPPGWSTTTPTRTTRSPARSSSWRPSGNLTRDHILDNITLYWLTGSGASNLPVVPGGLRTRRPAAGRQPLPPTTIPFAFTTFPGEIWRTPRSWVEELPERHLLPRGRQGGHFAPPGRSPSSSPTDIRARLRSLR